MTQYNYGYEDAALLNKADLYKTFNNYRINKFIIAMLLKLNKTNLPKYKVLEAGCGSGDKSRFLTELRVKPENCYGIDINESAIGICNELSNSAMSFVVGSVLDLPYEHNVFDIVICSGLMCCFKNDDDIRRVSEELYRVSQNGGVLIVIDINENFLQAYGQNPLVMAKGFRSFNTKTQELEKLLADNFDLCHQQPIFAADAYSVNQNQSAGVLHLPQIDFAIDNGDLGCAYSLWAFVAKDK